MTEASHDLLSVPQPEPSPHRKPWYQRAAVMIPLVLVVVTAIVFTVLMVARSGQNYAGGTAPATVPAQLHMAVTSALTDAPLATTLKFSDGTSMPVDANGSVTTDRVGPGGQVEISATGYVTAQVPVGADGTVTAALQPTFATVANQLQHWATDRQDDKITGWVLSAKTGFRYEAFKFRTNPWQVNCEVVDKEMVTVHVSVGSGFTTDPESLQQMFSKPQQITIAGQPAWHGSIPEDSGWFATYWQRQSLEITVGGTDQSATDAVLAGIVAAQPAS